MNRQHTDGESDKLPAMRASEAKMVSAAAQDGAIEYESIRYEACKLIADAAASGRLEVEIEVAPGMDWRLMDDLSRFDYDVRRVSRGLLSVSWA